MEVQWQGNSRLSNSSCRPLGVITAVQARCYLVLNMKDGTSFDDIKKTISDFFQSTYVIQQTNSG
eukprot:2230763-Amphidinium_carterae.1